MGLLDRNYNMEIYLKDGKIKQDRNFEVYNKDIQIFNIYVTLFDNAGNMISNSDLNDYNVELYVILPNGTTYKTITGVIDGSNNRLIFDLTSDNTNEVGTYQAEFMVTRGDEVVCTDSFKYTVSKCLHSDLTAASIGIGEISANPFEIMSERVDNKIDDVVVRDGKLIFTANGNKVRTVYLETIIKNVINKL